MEQVIALVLGALASWLQGHDGKGRLSKRARYLVAVAGSVLMALTAQSIGFWADGNFDWNELPTEVLRYEVNVALKCIVQNLLITRVKFMLKTC